MPGTYDIFFSYRRDDLSRAQPLLNALDSAGLRIWRNASRIDDGHAVTMDFRDGLATSKALVAFYSSAYSLSSACQEEFISAWLAAGQFPHRRVRVINPESGVDHIPALIRDVQSPILPQDLSGLSEFAGEMRGDVASLEGVLGAVDREQPRYYGIEPVHAKRFVGRAGELWDLHGKLTGHRASITTGVHGQTAAQVRGPGGNGKTLLAREYAILFGSAYPGGVFWLSAYGNDDTGFVDRESLEARRKDQLRELLGEFATNFPNLHISAERLKPEEIESTLWRHIMNHGAPCLWIVDDLPSSLVASDIERYWFARWPGASTLLTTRSREYGSLCDHLDLDVLAPSEAVELLSRHHCPKSTEESELAKIAEVLGYHPLALDVAGSYLAKGIQTFKQYLDGLSLADRNAIEYGALNRENLPTGHDRSISRTFFKSINLLGKEGLDFLCLASVLAVAPIHAELVQEAFESAGYGVASREHVLEVFDELDSLSLCENTGENARRVHTLISRAVHFRLREGNWMNRFWGLISRAAMSQSNYDERIGLLQKAVVRVLERRLSLAGDVGEHSRFANEVAHARHLTSIRLANVEDAALADWIARHDYERGDYSGARKLEEQVLEVMARLLGKEHPDTLSSMNNLAQMLKAQGDLAGARKLGEQVLEAMARLLGKDHPDTLKSMNNLAQMMKEQGDLVGARKLEEQVLETRARLLGEEHPDTLKSMNNLAQMMKEQGDLVGARKLEEQVLETRARLLGEEHPDTLKSMNNLALMLKAQGDLAGARKLEEQVLEARARLLDKEHPDILKSLSNLADTLKEQGDLAGAGKLEEQVFQARVRLLGKEHPDTLSSMLNLAATLYAQGDLAEARKLEEQVLEARVRLLGKEHPDTLISMNNLAGTLYAQGDLAGARNLGEQVLEAMARLLGMDHPDTLTSMSNLAHTLYAQGDLAGARKLEEQVLEARTRLLGHS